MLNWNQIRNPQLDIVGIVAILGEGSTTRNAQASALGWHHLLPRLLPAPQALLKHENIKRLPTVPGTVVGAYSGNIKFELNFFCQLLHKDDLARNQVELVYVSHVDEVDDTAESSGHAQTPHKTKATTKTSKSRWKKLFSANEQAYGIKKFSTLTVLSLIGFASSIGMIGLSIHLHDGFAFLAVLFLSVTSMIVGIASWWTLDFKSPPKADAQMNRQMAIPDSDVVIYYPRQGAFRVIRCSESISRLYFKSEGCDYVFGDDVYRLAALLASIFLMAGLLCMGNAEIPMQIAFASVYIALNAVYWAFSALNPIGRWGHWEHKYHCERIHILSPKLETKHDTPVRSETVLSDRNRPVLAQEPIAILEREANMTESPTKVTSRSPTEALSSNGKIGPAFTNIRQRRVTFQEAPRALSEPITTPTDIELAPMAEFVKSTSLPPLTTTIPPTQKSKRQQTFDLEGSKSRLHNPLGSVKDRLKHWLKELEIMQVEHNQTVDTFTTALWKAIVVTGTTKWLNQTHIAPENEVWAAWFKEAGKRAATFINDKGERFAAYTIVKGGHNGDDCIQLPSWNYQGRLDQLFAQEADQRKRRPPPAKYRRDEVEMVMRKGRNVVKGITESLMFKLVVCARAAKRRAAKRQAAKNELLRVKVPVRTLTADVAQLYH